MKTKTKLKPAEAEDHLEDKPGPTKNTIANYHTYSHPTNGMAFSACSSSLIFAYSFSIDTLSRSHCDCDCRIDNKYGVSPLLKAINANAA